MLCDLAFKRAHSDDNQSVNLRISAKRVLGSGGSPVSDERSFQSERELLGAFTALKLPDDIIADAKRTLSVAEASSKFTKFAEDVQIPFELLQAAGFYLYEE